MLEPISAAYLFALGVILVGLEALILSFVLFFFGIGFIVVAGMTLIYPFENGLVQIAIAFTIALISAYLLRNVLLNKLSKQPIQKEERTHISGTGYVEDGMVKFDGTYWKTLDDLSVYKEKEQVEVVDVVDNMVVLKK